MRPSSRPTADRMFSGDISEGMAGERLARSGARPARPGRLARGHALFFLDEPLAVDAIARERQGVQTLLGDRLAAALARAVRAVLDLLQGGDDLAQQPPVAVAQLEEKLARVGGVRLIAEILDRVVLLVLPVEGRAADFRHQLVLL